MCEMSWRCKTKLFVRDHDDCDCFLLRSGKGRLSRITETQVFTLNVDLHTRKRESIKPPLFWMASERNETFGQKGHVIRCPDAAVRGRDKSGGGNTSGGDDKQRGRRVVQPEPKGPPPISIGVLEACCQLNSTRKKSGHLQNGWEKFHCSLFPSWDWNLIDKWRLCRLIDWRVSLNRALNASGPDENSSGRWHNQQNWTQAVDGGNTPLLINQIPVHGGSAEIILPRLKYSLVLKKQELLWEWQPHHFIFWAMEKRKTKAFKSAWGWRNLLDSAGSCSSLQAVTQLCEFSFDNRNKDSHPRNMLPVVLNSELIVNLTMASSRHILMSITMYFPEG